MVEAGRDERRSGVCAGDPLLSTGEGVLGVSILDRGGDSNEKVAEEARLRPVA